MTGLMPSRLVRVGNWVFVRGLAARGLGRIRESVPSAGPRANLRVGPSSEALRCGASGEAEGRPSYEAFRCGTSDEAESRSSFEALRYDFVIFKV